ncbi:Hypothetical_protein [Hexamita inflata]|uniref:Hypothetical_protein n=1 Tax=Hexamita inflata TaxID=28002 RepID=A0AA86P139_9EUKA|nr:Hypothetical protein HINF_LOCUS18267 [Hexamita inflata]
MSDTNIEPDTQQPFNIDKIINQSILRVLYNGVLSQALHYLIIVFVLYQEQYILTTFNGYAFIENFVKIFPIIFLVSYEIPEFFEQYFANKKMTTYQTGNSVEDINRQEFTTNCIVAILMLIIPATQSVIFRVLQVDEKYRAMFLLSTVLGIIGPFKATIMSIFIHKQNYVYIMSCKMMTLIIHFSLFTFIYSFKSRETGINTWASGFSKPIADIAIYIVILVVLFKGNIFSTKINLDADQSIKFSLKPQRKDWKEIGKNLVAFFQYLVFFVSRPVVYFFIAFKINKLTDKSIKQDATINLYLYTFIQQTFSFIAKGCHSALMTTVPIVFNHKQYKKALKIICYSCILSLIYNEIMSAVFVLDSNSVFILFFNQLNDPILKNYYESGEYKTLLKSTVFFIGTDVLQYATNTYAYLTNYHFIPLIIGLLRIICGVFLTAGMDSQLGQNASYDEVFFYFELMCTILAVIFCIQAYISMLINYKSETSEKKNKKAKEKIVDDFIFT